MKKIIITGATSMLGVALTEVAVREGTEVYAIVRPTTNRSNRIIISPQVHVVKGTLESLNEINDLPNDCDVLYHFAWAGTSKATRDDPIIQNKNISYTLDAVELASRSGCKRFVGAGSQAEYGSVNGIIDETTKYAPTISYGIAKYAASILSKKLCEEKGITYVWGRVFSVYGPHDNDGTMLNYAIHCWEKGETARFSSGDQSWNYLYETDAGEMFYRLGMTTLNTDNAFIANNESLPLKEYIHILMDVYGDKAKAVFETSSANSRSGLNVNASNTIKMLHYQPKIEFRQGIKKMIEATRHISD